MNRKLYIHELIDVIGHNRARYMHHMTADGTPVGRHVVHVPRPVVPDHVDVLVDVDLVVHVAHS